MKRYEACEILTKIALDELIDLIVCKELLKTRDIVVCEPHKILDVLATDAQRDMFKNQLLEYISRMKECNMYSFDVMKQLEMLRRALEGKFEDGCDKMYSSIRCANCPNYKNR